MFYSNRLSYSYPDQTDVNDICQNFTWNIIRNLSRGIPWPYTSEDAVTFVETCKSARQTDPHTYVLRLKDSPNEFIGCVGLNIIASDSCERAGKIGYWIAERHQNQGYATEAALEMIRLARELKLPEVWASAREDNLPSIRVFNKIGLSFSEKRGAIFEHKFMQEVVFCKNLSSCNIF